jgi:hypothetical protein
MMTSLSFITDSKAKRGSISLRTAKEHLFARMLVERSEEIQSLTSLQLQTKISATYGWAALDILNVRLDEADLSHFVTSNGITNLFEFCNDTKIYYSDPQVRYSLIFNLVFKFARVLFQKGSYRDCGLDLLAYVTDAIAFLSKSKIQFVEDFGKLFPINRETPVKPDSGNDRKSIDLGTLIKLELGLTEPSWDFEPLRTLRICDFSVELHEAALLELAAGSFKADLTHQGKHNTGGKNRNYGEKAYWDIFFWLCPGLWIQKNLNNVRVVL